MPNDWIAIFETWGVKKGSKAITDYEYLKRQIAKYDLDPFEYQRAIKAASDYVKI